MSAHTGGDGSGLGVPGVRGIKPRQQGRAGIVGRGAGAFRGLGR